MYDAMYVIMYDIMCEMMYDLILCLNKVALFLSKIMVTWIFGHYQIVHEMHSMWFMWKATEDINHKFFVNSEL